MIAISPLYLGIAAIAIDCLEVSANQVRPIAPWLVNDIAGKMLEFTDNSYQSFVVLTKNLANTDWNIDQVIVN